jgi:pimeloyl-ACP methyl ester carboxylesterase
VTRSSTLHERGFLVHRGHRLAYEVHGEGPHVLVYLHGILLDANINRRLASRLADAGNRVVLLDLLGHGRSSKPAHAAEHRMDLYVRQVVALLDALGVEEAALGGLSLGANVSLLTAVHHPDRVRGLVLEMPVLERAAPAIALTFVPPLLGLHSASGPARFAMRGIGKLPRTGFGPVDALLEAGSMAPEQMAAILHGVLLGPVAPTQEQRRALRVPVLVIGHPADALHPFTDAESLVRDVQGATLVRARSILELRVRPHRLTKEISAFLDRVYEPGRAHGLASISG